MAMGQLWTVLIFLAGSQMAYSQSTTQRSEGAADVLGRRTAIPESEWQWAVLSGAGLSMSRLRAHLMNGPADDFESIAAPTYKMTAQTEYMITPDIGVALGFGLSSLSAGDGQGSFKGRDGLIRTDLRFLSFEAGPVQTAFGWRFQELVSLEVGIGERYELDANAALGERNQNVSRSGRVGANLRILRLVYERALVGLEVSPFVAQLHVEDRERADRIRGVASSVILGYDI